MYGYLVTGEDSDIVLAHLAGDMSGYYVAIFQLYSEHGVRQGFDDLAAHFDVVFFRHGYLFDVVVVIGNPAGWVASDGSVKPAEAFPIKSSGLIGVRIKNWLLSDSGLIDGMRIT